MLGETDASYDWYFCQRTTTTTTTSTAPASGSQWLRTRAIALASLARAVPRRPSGRAASKSRLGRRSNHLVPRWVEEEEEERVVGVVSDFERVP